MKSGPYHRNEKPDEAIEIISSSLHSLRNLKEKIELSEIIQSLESVYGRLDQKNVKELLKEAVENIKINKKKLAIDKLEFALRKLGYKFDQDEDLKRQVNELND
tara:strand:+ start:144 stop:455 length:312 start_codon:yes stop_codon:yes gene_type:complete